MSAFDHLLQDLHSDHEGIREVHALTPPLHPLESPPPSMATSDRVSRGGFSNTSVTNSNSTLVLAGSPVATSMIGNDGLSSWGFGFHPSLSPTQGDRASVVTGGGRELSARNYKKEEVESKISAWQTAKISEINNGFKCEEAIINGWESDQAQQSSLRMKKVERKLEEKRARAMEKMENEIVKAHKKAEERKASAEAKRGTKIARVLEVANLMKAVGRSPVKSSFF